MAFDRLSREILAIVQPTKRPDPQRRGDHPDDQIEDEDKPHMEGMKTHSGENGGENWGKEDDSRSCLHETSHNEEDEVNDQHKNIGIVGDGEKQSGNLLWDLLGG